MVKGVRRAEVRMFPDVGLSPSVPSLTKFPAQCSFSRPSDLLLRFQEVSLACG